MATAIMLGNNGWLASSRWRWAKTLAWLFVLAGLCIFVFNVSADTALRLAAMVSGEAFTTRAAAPSVARLIAVVVGSIVMLITYAVATKFVERRSIPELGVKQLVPDFAIGLGIGGLLILMIVTPMWAAGWVTITSAPVTHIAESLKQAIQSGVIEEVLMRLIIFRLLWRAAGVFPALILTAILFGGLHLSNPDSTFFAATCLVAGEGVGVGLYLLTGRIWMSIGMHAGWNFTQGWIFGSAVSGLNFFVGGPLQTRPTRGIPEILSGGAFGLESSLATLLVSLAGSIYVLILAWKKGRFIVDENQKEPRSL